MSIGSAEALSGAAAQRLARYADELIPAVDGLPAPSETGVHGDGFARYAALLPGHGERVAAALERAAEADAASVFALREVAPEAFRIIAEAVAGIYLTEAPVMAAYGYRGRVPLEGGDPHRRVEAYAPLVAPVVARGWVWHGDGSVD